jgi:hypothetical protein
VITLFALPRRFEGEAAVHQRHALASWARLGPYRTRRVGAPPARVRERRHRAHAGFRARTAADPVRFTSGSSDMIDASRPQRPREVEIVTIEPRHDLGGRRELEAFAYGVVVPAVRFVDPRMKPVLVAPDDLHAAVYRPAVDGDVLEVGVILGHHAQHRRLEVAHLIQRWRHDGNRRQRRHGGRQANDGCRYSTETENGVVETSRSGPTR